MSSNSQSQKILMPPVSDDPDGKPYHVYLETDGALTFWQKFATQEEAQREQAGPVRRVRRVITNLEPAYWGLAPDCQLQDRITSLSSQGCFLQTAEQVSARQTAYVNFPFPRDEGQTDPLRCEVRYCLEGIGLGLVFNDLSAEDSAALHRFVEDLAARQSESDETIV